MPLAAAIAGGLGLFGSLLNSRSQSRTNIANYRIAQMNNEWNEKMMEKQMAYNTEMWNKENEYNSAANQVQRLKEAGLNPYLTLGNAGSAGSAGSVTPPQAQSVMMQAPQFDTSIFASSMGQFAQLSMQKRKIDEEVKAMQIDNMTRAQKNLAELFKLQESARNDKEKADMQNIINRWQDRFLSLDYELKQNQIKSAEQDIQMKINQNLMLSKELSIFDEKSRLEMANVVSSTLLNHANRLLTGKQTDLTQVQKDKVRQEIRNAISERYYTIAKRIGVEISNDVAKRTADALVYKITRESTYGSGLHEMPGASLGLLQSLLTQLFN